MKKVVLTAPSCKMLDIKMHEPTDLHSEEEIIDMLDDLTINKGDIETVKKTADVLNDEIVGYVLIDDGHSAMQVYASEVL